VHQAKRAFGSWRNALRIQRFSLLGRKVLTNIGNKAAFRYGCKQLRIKRVGTTLSPIQLSQKPVLLLSGRQKLKRKSLLPKTL